MAHEGLWEQLEKLDGEQTAKRANCRYFSEPPRYFLNMLNTEYVIDISERKIYSTQEESGQKSAEFLEQLYLLAYLINAKDLPLAGKLVKAESFPGGQFFFRGLHKLPTKKLEDAFGNEPEFLYKASRKFDSKKCEYGDVSIELKILPNLPITIIIWGKSEEFGARASILFDSTAASQLPLDALQTAVNLAVGALIKNELC